MKEEFKHTFRSLTGMYRSNGHTPFSFLTQYSSILVFTETLRKYPIVPFLDRMSNSDYKLTSPSGDGTIILPAGTSVYIPVLGFQNDPKYFPEPHKYDPDRFTDENKRSRPNYTYLPFGEGPRICIGKDTPFHTECMRL
jgi:cytochrome P450 family 6